MKDLLIGIDLGTTGCKAVVTDHKLNILGKAYIEYELIKLSSQKIEQDASEWWELTKEVVGVAVDRAGIDPCLIKGLSISSQGIALVPVDDRCHPLRNAISWLDSRAEKQISPLSRVSIV